VADDITGAAEVAGVGLRQGLRVTLDAAVDTLPADPHLWVLALDTRSMQRDDAVAEIQKIIAKLMNLGVCRIFKKTDSALRGHIVAELEAQRKLQDKTSVLLCPANPAGGRKIINGIYYIKDIPLHLTGFANDPEFPATTSDVRKLLQQTDISAIPSSFTVANATSSEDLRTVASQVTENVVPAGSAAFFEAWLSSLNLAKSSTQLSFTPSTFTTGKTLIVCGSAFHGSYERVQIAGKKGAPVFYISPCWIGMPQLAHHLQRCADDAVQALHIEGRAIVAVDQPTIEGKKMAAALRDATAKVTEKILQAAAVHELIVEGGATTFAIVRRMGFSRFLPLKELVPGVVRMNVLKNNNLYITIKPGSYEFPPEIWE
jgi:uncharacterized protein YgbK (DUF1537 family)